MLGPSSGIQRAQHTPYPADIPRAQSGDISGLEISPKRPTAEGAYHSGRDDPHPSGRQVSLDVTAVYSHAGWRVGA